MPVDALVLLFLILFLPMACAAVCLIWLWTKARRRLKLISPDRIAFVERTWVILPCAAFLAIYVLCFLWAWLVEAYWVEVTKTEIPVDRPVLGFDRFRIVHLSDLHCERETRRERAVLEAVRDAQPHLILLTGDYLNAREYTPTLETMLRALDAPYGVFGVPGNWDRKFDIPSLFRAAARNRGSDFPRFLEDEYVLLKRDEHKLLLVGQGIAPHRGLSELLKDASPDAYRIFLQHMPDAVEQITALPPGERLDLFLCGHTHGGQVRLPLWGAVVTLSKFHKKYEMGYYRVGATHMYVNRGVGLEGGFAPRVRFLCRPEVAVIDLVAR